MGLNTSPLSHLDQKTLAGSGMFGRNEGEEDELHVDTASSPSPFFHALFENGKYI